MKKVFIHNAIFRILAPVGYGIIVYILILLVFDSVQSLNENFFNQEAFLCIGLSYLVFESFRLASIVLDKLLPTADNLTSRIAVQLFLTTSLAAIIVSGVIYIYFREFLNFTSFETELFAFNAIFVVTSLLYNMLYLSMAYLHLQNEAKLEEESIKQRNLEYQMLCFNNEINPDLLYSSLETLIDLLYYDEEDSEQFIDKLSSVYRYILSNKNNELVSLSDELAAAEDLLYLLNVKHQDQIKVQQNFSEASHNRQLVPGTLNLILENITSNNLITIRRPLSIKYYQEEDYLVVQAKTNEKLSISNKYNLRGSLKEAYAYFTILPIIELKAYGELFIKAPLLQLQTVDEMSQPDATTNN